MLTLHDIRVMENDVDDIIRSWQTDISILRPLPKEEQPSYNKITGEYTGGRILYNQIDTKAERKDVTNYLASNVRADLAGLIEDGDYLYAVPMKYKDEYDIYQPLIVTVDDIFILPKYNEHRFIVKAIKDRIGEQIVLVKRQVGGTLSGWLDDIEIVKILSKP